MGGTQSIEADACSMSTGHTYTLNSGSENLNQDIRGKQDGEVKLRAFKKILEPKELHLLRKSFLKKSYATELAIQINYLLASVVEE